MTSETEPTEAQKIAAKFLRRKLPRFEKEPGTSTPPLPDPKKTPASNPAIKKVFIAVHGVGDQTKQETIQSVVTRFCAHRNYPGLVALGAFYDGDPAFELKGPPTPPELVADIGFIEVYWADIPRQVANNGYVLQETKAWARSIVERVRILSLNNSAGKLTSHVDYKRVGDVLEEMITTIQVLEALTFLAKKAGIIDFNLRKLLDDYVGDVQIVTEFAPYRENIISAFNSILADVQQQYPAAEIYVVAHSEGTVVSWLGLLRAMSDPNGTPPWVPQVRGFMTIGSPIDKHLLMWPELFKAFKGPHWTPDANRIKWRNYSDYGDPIGFELDTARAWMKRQGYDRNFDFDPKDDFAFGRYYLPGKAHTDYWNDDAVFGHFIDSVVQPLTPPPSHGPKNKPGAELCSYVAAYAIPLGVIYGGVYLLYKTLGRYLNLKPDQGPAHLARNVLLIGGLVAGVTVFWRLVRLTRSLKWWLIGFLVFLATAFLFAEFVVVTEEIRWFNPFIKQGIGPLAHWTLLPIFGLAMVILQNSGPEGSVGKPAPGQRHSTTGRRQIGRVKTVMMVVGAVLVLNVGCDWMMHRATRGPAWALITAIFAAVYLWWLGTMIFDLVFVWHRYIRYAVALEFMRKALWKENESDKRSDGNPSSA